jgi:mannitol-1-phosphate 5-dehydrogenase
MKTILIFGAGNIGRSFIAPVFSDAGYSPCFVDVNDALIAELNRRKAYPVIIRHPDGREDLRLMEQVRCVDGKEKDYVIEEIISADLCATCVGQAALPRILPVLAEGLLRRKSAGNKPLDIIIAENIRDGAGFFRQTLSSLLGDHPDSYAGLVESSIGKMVPIMKSEDLARDPLLLFAEPYNTLILARNGFLNQPPVAPSVKLVENIRAWVDRKLFIHNLGHFAAACLGYAAHPELTMVWQALEDPSILKMTRNAMTESAAGLHAEYPSDMPSIDLEEHIDDLLRRFRNSALGDSIHRVGRGLRRKLGPDDRLIGAMRLCVKHAKPFTAMTGIFRAALRFRATDENGLLYPDDKLFIEEDITQGVGHILSTVCGLTDSDCNLIRELSRPTDANCSRLNSCGSGTTL